MSFPIPDSARRAASATVRMPLNFRITRYMLQCVGLQGPRLPHLACKHEGPLMTVGGFVLRRALVRVLDVALHSLRQLTEACCIGSCHGLNPIGDCSAAPALRLHFARTLRDLD